MKSSETLLSNYTRDVNELPLNFFERNGYTIKTNVRTLKTRTAVKKLVVDVDSLWYEQTKHLKMYLLTSCMWLVKDFDTLSPCTM